jgi:flagellar basal-body rod protein FlgF
MFHIELFGRCTGIFSDFSAAPQLHDAGWPMDPLMIAAASGMKSRMESLDMLANNVANTGVAGFKSDREFYNLYASDEAAAFNADPARLPLVERPWTDFSQGTLVPTDNPTDLAISGSGFFVVDSPTGPLYTRNGAFRIDATGRLETQDGYAVRLERPNGTPATIDPTRPFEVTPDGVVRQEGQEIGRIRMVDFEDRSALRKLGNTYFKVDAAVVARAAAGAQVKQGSLEAANVPVAEAAVRLVGVMRQFEMLQRAMSLGGDMNKRAIEEVARVS